MGSGGQVEFPSGVFTCCFGSRGKDLVCLWEVAVMGGLVVEGGDCCGGVWVGCGGGMGGVSTVGAWQQGFTFKVESPSFCEKDHV